MSIKVVLIAALCLIIGAAIGVLAMALAVAAGREQRSE